MEKSQRIRLALSDANNSQLVNLLTKEPVSAWSHSDWRLELGFLKPDKKTIESSYAVLASVTMELFAAKGDTTALLTRTIASGSFTACSQADWDNWTNQHLVMEFSSLETAFTFADAQKADKTYYAVIYGLTTDVPAHRVPLWVGNFTVKFLGAPAGAVVIANGNLVATGAVYDGDGEYALSGLVSGQMYQYVKGAEDVSLVCGGTTLTESGIFQATAATATLNGNASQDVTAIVRSGGTYSAAEVDARIASGAPIVFEGLQVRDLDTDEVVTVEFRSTKGGFGTA